MTSPFAKLSDLTGGTIFKAANHMNDQALMIEPKHINRGVPNTYNGKTTLRDEVTADITVFATSEALDKAEPTTVIKNAKVVHTMLTSTLEAFMGGVAVAVVRTVATKSGQGYAFRPVEAGVEAAVAAYYERRAATMPALPAADGVPSFADDVPSFADDVPSFD